MTKRKQGAADPAEEAIKSLPPIGASAGTTSPGPLNAVFHGRLKPNRLRLPRIIELIHPSTQVDRIAIADTQQQILQRLDQLQAAIDQLALRTDASSAGGSAETAGAEPDSVMAWLESIYSYVKATDKCISKLATDIRETKKRFEDQADQLLQCASHQDTLLKDVGARLERVLEEGLSVPLSAETDPDWTRIEQMLEPMRTSSGASGAGLLLDIVQTAEPLGHEVRLLIALAQCLSGRGNTGDAALDRLCRSDVTERERRLLIRAEKELVALQNGTLAALERVRTYMTAQPPDPQPLRHLEGKALAQLFQLREGSQALDTEHLRRMLVHRLVSPLLSIALYLTHSCLVERLGDIAAAREATSRLLQAIAGRQGISTLNFDGDRYETAAIPLMEAIGWRWVVILPYLDVLDRARALAEKFNVDASILMGPLAGLTESPHAARLDAAGMVARVDIPLLVSRDNRSATSPTYRVVVR